jgi:hypothetical protein
MAAAAAEAGDDLDAVAGRRIHTPAPSNGSRLSSTKGRHFDLRTIISLLISTLLRGSVNGRDPQAPSTLWIMIIRQHWRNSMLHSASCLELVLLVTPRWCVIPSALGNHHTNQTRRNDRHNRHRRGPAAPTPFEAAHVTHPAGGSVRSQ